jgi:hypothetical protein
LECRRPRAARCDLLAADFVAKGAGRSAGVISRRTPGASEAQSPNAAAPVRTRLVGQGRSGADKPNKDEKSESHSPHLR